MKYDSGKTLTENTSEIISEQWKAALEDLGKVAARDAEGVTRSLETAFKDGTVKMSEMVTQDGVRLTKVSDVLENLRLGKLGPSATGSVAKGLFLKGSTSEIRALAADSITSMGQFTKKFANKSRQEIVSELMSKYSKQDADLLADTFLKKRGIGQDVVKSGEEVAKTGQEVAKSSEAAGTVTKTSDGIVIKGDNNIVYMSKDGSSMKVVNSETNETLNITKGQKIKSGTGVELTATELPSTETMSTMEKMSQKLKDIAKKAVTSKWNWKRILKWCAAIGITGRLLWWYFATHDGPVPDDIPTTPPDDNDNNNDGGNDDGIYTTPGDPYQYKVVDCVWFTKSLEQRGKIISDWTSLANNQKAIGILDGRFPEARQNCNGNTSSTTTTTTTTGSTVTQTPQDKLNQDYNVTPQPNAQAEVQTTNDDINNY